MLLLLQRLHRSVPGERQMGKGTAELQAQARLEREGLKAREQPKQVPARTGKQRRSQLHCTAGPNVPQMIRLVRTPFALSPGWARRQPYGEIGLPKREMNVDRSAVIEHACRERETPTRPRATERPRPCTQARRNWRSVEEDS
ncbi:MAG: hypothetical protein ACI9VR_001810 [Cognaticolwellia sp.]